MKIAHISDLHLGYNTGVRKTPQLVGVREQDGYDAFRTVIEEIINEGDIDAVVVGGDTFHTPTPSVRAVLEAQQGFRALAHAGIKVYNIAGNHDTNDIRGDIAASRIIHDERRNIFSHAEPYTVREIGEGVYLHMISHHMFSLQGDTMLKVKPVEGAVNILTAHGSAIDPILEIQLKAEQSPREIVIPDYILQDNRWNCVMLGHIHERGWVGGSPDENGAFTDDSFPILYNGSLIRRGFADKEGNLGRGWTKWTIETDGTFTFEFRCISQRPQYDLPIIVGTDSSRESISEQLVAHVKSVMKKHKDFNLATAPIVRQRIANITPAQKAGIDWRGLSEFKENMLSWQCSFVTSKDPKQDEKRDSSPALSLVELIAERDRQHQLAKEAEGTAGTGTEREGKSAEEEAKELSDLGKSMRNKSTGNLVSDFDVFLTKDAARDSLSGFKHDRKQSVVSYSKKKVEEAHSKALAEEE